MRLEKCAILCALLALSLFEPLAAKKNFGSGGRGGGHSYPKSGGLSGSGGSHGYPSSGGLSGSGGSHGYPSSGGSHGYPSSGGSHGYPSSGGSHGYPSSGGLSGSGTANTHHSSNHGSYPAGKGLSGNTGSSTTTVHHHYHYSPPKQISYTPTHGGAPVSYPVYRGSPPNYVYQYKDSGSKYGTLLAGLALLNLGTLAGTAYAISQTHSGSGSSSSGYKAQPGEICKFGVKKDNGDYEETRIDCQLITSFIYQEEAAAHSGTNSTTVTTSTTVTNSTTLNAAGGAQEPASVATSANETVVVPNVLYEMLPNGTLVPSLKNNTVELTVNATSEPPPVNNGGSVVSTVTNTTTTTTVTNALDVKGKPIDVTPGMKCYVIRQSSVSNMKKTVPCGLLQTYADKSLQKNSGIRNAPVFSVIAVTLAAFLLY